MIACLTPGSGMLSCDSFISLEGLYSRIKLFRFLVFRACSFAATFSLKRARKVIVSLRAARIEFDRSLEPFDRAIHIPLLEHRYPGIGREHRRLQVRLELVEPRGLLKLF